MLNYVAVIYVELCRWEVGHTRISLEVVTVAALAL
jgi:hypothetical protein